MRFVQLAICLLGLTILVYSCGSTPVSKEHPMNSKEKKALHNLLDNLEQEVRLVEMMPPDTLVESGVELQLYDSSNVFICDTFSFGKFGWGRQWISSGSFTQMVDGLYDLKGMLGLDMRFGVQLADYYKVFKSIGNRPYLLVVNHVLLQAPKLTDRAKFNGIAMYSQMRLVRRTDKKVIGCAHFMTNSSVKVKDLDQLGEEVAILSDFYKNYYSDFNKALNSIAAPDREME